MLKIPLRTEESDEAPPGDRNAKCVAQQPQNFEHGCAKQVCAGTRTTLCCATLRWPWVVFVSVPNPAGTRSEVTLRRSARQPLLQNSRQVTQGRSIGGRRRKDHRGAVGQRCVSVYTHIVCVRIVRVTGGQHTQCARRSALCCTVHVLPCPCTLTADTRSLPGTLSVCIPSACDSFL